MATQCADQIHPRNLGPFFHLHVRKRVIKDGYFDQVVSEAFLKIGLVGARLDHAESAPKCFVDIDLRWRILEERERVLERALSALERTVVVAVAAYEIAFGEDAEVELGYVGLQLGAEAIVQTLRIELDEIGVAVEMLVDVLLCAVEDARRSRVSSRHINHLWFRLF